MNLIPKLINHNFLIYTILTFFFIGSLLTNFTNRIEGDAGFHALITREILERQFLAASSDHILATDNVKFPIAYPQMFHFTGALMYTLIGDYTFFVLPSIYGLLSLIFLLFILKGLNINKLATVLALFFLALNVSFIDYSSKYFMEIGLVFTTLAALAYSINFTETKKISYFYIASIFYGFSIGIKQQGFLILPVYFTLIVYSFFRLKFRKEIIISLFLVVIFCLGPLLQLFKSTGSVLYAGDSLPRIIQITEKPFRDFFGIKLLEGDSVWPKLNEGRRDQELLTWRNFTNSLTAWMEDINLRMFPWNVLLVLALFLLIINLIKHKKMSELLLLIFLLCFYSLFYYLARPRYSLPLIILPSIIIFYIMIYFHKRKLFLIIFSSLIISFLIISFANSFPQLLKRDEFGFYGKVINQREGSLLKTYEVIKSDNANDFVILSPIPYETAYYTNKQTAWANPYGSTELFRVMLSKNDEEAIKIFKKYKVKYLIIYKDRFMRFTNWAGITPNDGFLSNLNHSKYFQLISENDAARVYLLKG